MLRTPILDRFPEVFNEDHLNPALWTHRSRGRIRGFRGFWLREHHRDGRKRQSENKQSDTNRKQVQSVDPYIASVTHNHEKG